MAYELNESGEWVDTDYAFTPEETPEEPLLLNDDYDLGTGPDTTGSPVDFAGGESQDHGLTSSEALAGQGWTQDEVGNWYKVGSGGQYAFIGGDGKTYTFDATKGGFLDSAGRLISGAISKSLGNSVKNLVYKKDAAGNPTDELDFAKLLTLGGGALAMAGSNTRTQPSGYQGGIPKYTATRQAPGIGQLLSGNVTYQKADGTVVNPNPAAPSTGVAPPGTGVNAERLPADAPTTLAHGGALKSGGFIVPADVVSHLGNGSSAAGLQLLARRFGASSIKGKGDGMSDSIPTTIDGKEKARVANEEAYMSPEQVARLGGGDRSKGAQKLRDMMSSIRKARTGTEKQGTQINPNKFMPGGEVKRYAAGDSIGTAATAGVTGTESNLSNWAGPYVTDMLAKGQAVSEMPYEQYTGPLTAGPSAIQQKMFTGLEGIGFPGQLGKSFSAEGAPSVPQYDAAGGTSGGGITGGAPGVAQSYMNPYLSAVLNPQLEEMRRQAKINNLQGLGAFTKSGAFGGGRQAIMESEGARNLLQEQNKTIGQGYASAFDKGREQFNTEQQQGRSLADLFATQGQAQRGIESEEVAADKAQFEEARMNLYKMVQFQQSLLSGLPLSAQTYNMAVTNNLTQFAQGTTALSEALKALGILPSQ